MTFTGGWGVAVEHSHLVCCNALQKDLVSCTRILKRVTFEFIIHRRNTQKTSSFTILGCKPATNKTVASHLHTKYGNY